MRPPIKPRPDLADLPPAKHARGGGPVRIGDAGPMGRILVRGEKGHNIINDLAPIAGEPVIDNPGKGAFHATDLGAILANRSITQLVVTGVTTEVCVNTTVREANDRGFACLVVADCCASYFPEFHAVGLRMIAAQGGIFGWVGQSADVMAAIFALIGAGLTFFGFIHAESLGIGQSLTVAVGYAAVAGLLYLCARQPQMVDVTAE